MIVKVPELPYSEVCMHMKIAGKPALVKLLPHNMAQVYIDGKPFSAPITRGEAGVRYGSDDLIPKGYRKPGDKVKIACVDPFGLLGRDRHPPLNHHHDDPAKPCVPDSPCDGKDAYVVQYYGWEHEDGSVFIWSEKDQSWSASALIWFSSTHDYDPEIVYAMAPEPAVDPHDASDNPEPRVPTHFYLLVVPGIGVYEFADYELEEDEIALPAQEA